MTATVIWYHVCTKPGPAGRPFIEMVRYHALLWSLDPDKWPKPSGSIFSRENKREYYAQHLVWNEQFAESWWKYGQTMLDAGRPVS
jgi:hypothetical protein